MYSYKLKRLKLRIFILSVIFLTISIGLLIYVNANYVLDNTGINEIYEYNQTLYMFNDNLIINDIDLNYKPSNSKLNFVDLKAPLHYKKVRIVRDFLKSYNAPLADYAEDFVTASEIYHIDYRLAPAISIVESSGGKRLFRPYNPFGWGGKSYSSFKEAIYDVSRGLSVYYSFGAKTPEAISKNYNPVTPKSWAAKVRFLMNKMPELPPE